MTTGADAGLTAMGFTWSIVADISDHGNDLPRALAGPIHRTCAGFAQ
jgi:hypothetical protein